MVSAFTHLSLHIVHMLLVLTMFMLLLSFWQGNFGHIEPVHDSQS